jgi:pSer/pThr/pTyr-binding forkhead associated (FHA) protein
MSQVTITLLRFGLLGLLWIFVISIIGVLRNDIYGTKVSRRSQRRASRTEQAAPRGAAVPVPAATPAVSHTPPAGAIPAPAHRAGARPGVLTVTAGALAGSSVPLRAAGVVIGRNPECSLVLTDDYASGRHARVFGAPDGWYVEDLGSTNGTLLDGAKLTPHAAQPARNGAVLTIGRTTIELRG